MNIVKELSFYLPYNLCFYGASDIQHMYSISVKGDVLLRDCRNHNIVVHEYNVGSEFAPILKPMDMLGIFIPEDYDGSLWGQIETLYAPPYTDLKYGFSTHGMYFAFENKVLRLHQAAELPVWQKLFEHHFDVFGLIGKGLAVDFFSFPENKVTKKGSV